MTERAIKYTKAKPRIISSPKMDSACEPEDYRRYSNHIIGFGLFFIVLYGLSFNLFFSKLIEKTVHKSFNIINVFLNLSVETHATIAIGYVFILAVYLSLIFVLTKKSIYYFTKPVNRVVIKEGLYIIRGQDVFDELKQAFKERNIQK
jgi:hypothetical protein